MSSEVVGRLLNDLNIWNLKKELEKRKLNTFGSRNALVERLENALKEEGTDPEKYLFILLNKNESTNSNDSEISRLSDASETEEIKIESLDIEDIQNIDEVEDLQYQLEDSTYSFQHYIQDDEESLNLNIDNQFLVEGEVIEEYEDKEKIEENILTKKNYVKEKTVSRTKREFEIEPKKEIVLTKVVSNKRQMTRLVELMKQNLNIARGTIFRSSAKRKWEEFAVELNNLGPPTRDSEKWQRVWCDLKTKVRKKLNDSKEDSKKSHQFSITEEAVISILQLNSSINPPGEAFVLCDEKKTKTSVIEERDSVADIANETEFVNDEPNIEGEPKREITKIVSNQRQMLRLVELMEQNLDIGRGIVSKARAKKKWEEFARELNSLGPPERNSEKWQRVWTDLKTKVKKKINDNKEKIGGSSASHKYHQFSNAGKAVINLLQLSSSSNCSEEISASDGKQNAQITIVKEHENEPESNNLNLINTTESTNEKFESMPENSNFAAYRRHKRKQRMHNDQRLHLLKKQTDSQKQYQQDMKHVLGNIQKDMHSLEKCIRENYYENKRYKKRKLEIKQKKIDLLEQDIKNKEKKRKDQELYRKAKLEIKTQNMLALEKKFPRTHYT